VANFNNGYLDQHLEVAQQLAQNPKLVDDPQFRAAHPGLDQYLASHPEVRSQLQQHPERFMTAEPGSARDSIAKSNTARGTAEARRAFEASMHEHFE
jgi:hypothetical protein